MTESAAAGATVVCACDEHLRRPWLLRRLGAGLEQRRARINELLALDDGALIASLGGADGCGLRREYGRWRHGDAEQARDLARESGLSVICACAPAYPEQLRGLDSAPPVLYVAGELERFESLWRADPIAIVGARRSSDYGEAVAESLGRQLSDTGLTVVSGMAGGIDSCAHRGALRGGGATVAVLPGSAHTPYPRRALALHRQITRQGAVISEQAPGAPTRRWTFTARNRIIAAMARLTVVVEARARSGAFVTAAVTRSLGRPVGAVPGQITNPAAFGPNRLLAEGALVIRGAQDALDAVYGLGAMRARCDDRPALSDEQRRVLEAVAGGAGTPRKLAAVGIPEAAGMVELAALELAGWVARGAGGHFTVIP